MRNGGNVVEGKKTCPYILSVVVKGRNKLVGEEVLKKKKKEKMYNHQSVF